MNDELRGIAIRLAAALGFPVEPEWFGVDTAWGLVAKLEAAMHAKQRLDPATLQLLSELAIAMGMRGGDEGVFHQALERRLGTSPFSPEAIVAVVRYVRTQLHFDAAPKRVELDPSHAVYVPLKNYDYE